jgi:hypothetical protein
MCPIIGENARFIHEIDALTMLGTDYRLGTFK